MKLEEIRCVVDEYFSPGKFPTCIANIICAYTDRTPLWSKFWMNHVLSDVYNIGWLCESMQKTDGRPHTVTDILNLLRDWNDDTNPWIEEKLYHAVINELTESFCI